MCICKQSLCLVTRLDLCSHLQSGDQQLRQQQPSARSSCAHPASIHSEQRRRFDQSRSRKFVSIIVVLKSLLQAQQTIVHIRLDFSSLFANSVTALWDTWELAGRAEALQTTAECCRLAPDGTHAGTLTEADEDSIILSNFFRRDWS